MLYQIKRCSAPCVGNISENDYAKLVRQAQDFLSGKSREIQDALAAEMQSLSDAMDYEKARVIRDRIRTLNILHGHRTISTENIESADIIALAREGKLCCVQVFSIRGGHNYGNKAYFPSHAMDASNSEVLEAFIGQYYQTHPAPATILVSHLVESAALMEEALWLHADHKVEILHPLRGSKRDLMEQAVRNAREALARHQAINVSQREALEGVQKLFGLEEPPSRIEVYDNSHIGGTHAVGAMIVAGPEGFVKSEYRKFNIKQPDTAPGDDYAMLREVLTRRFVRLQDSDDTSKTPNLVLIDGGAGQVSSATKVFGELGVQGVCYVGIAKGPDRNAGREEFYIPGREPFTLPPDDPVLHYLQRLRDEAHRFAIGAHRNKRSKAIQTSELDAIPFIGPGRKKALLQHFGSVRAISAASMEEIRQVPGINKNTAGVIYRYFHP